MPQNDSSTIRNGKRVKKKTERNVFKKKMRECFGILKLVQKSNFSIDLCDAQTERMICNKNRN